jgi:ubiquinone/menaquinone biosynthesis C-methylase UbiE
MARGPDREASLAQYRQRAAIYDFELALFEPVRRSAVARLELRPGQTVIDVGCGTGLSLPLLVDAVGRRGHVIGIEQSPDMLERARGRVRSSGWRQVELLESPVESARIPRLADAALFHFTHDILQRPEAVATVIAALKPGAMVVASGLKWAPPWALAVNLMVLPAALRSVTSLAGLEAPWQLLQAHLHDWHFSPALLGGAYVMSGRLDQ